MDCLRLRPATLATATALALLAVALADGDRGGEGVGGRTFSLSLPSMFARRTTTPTSALQDEPEMCDCTCGERNFGSRIVGGEPALPNEFPWIVRLSYFNRFYCGGMLINDRYVLTAAHCVKGFMWFMIKVTFGEHDRCDAMRPRPETRFVLRAVTGDFSYLNFDNDIAVLRLNDRVPFTETIRPICLPRDYGQLYEGKMAIVSGWGTLKEDGKPACVLQEVEVPVMSNDECKNTLYNEKMISDNMMCAGYKDGGKDSCQGDSGGPLIREMEDKRYELIGVVSWGNGCARPGFPGIYTRVTRYLDWIKSQTAGGCWCYDEPPTKPTKPPTTTTTENNRLTTEKHEATTEKVDVTSEKHEETTEKHEVTTDKQEMSTEKHEVTTEKVEVTSEKHEETTEKHEVTTDKQEMSTEKQEMTSEKHEVTTEKQEMSTEKQEMTSEKHEVTTEKQEMSTEKQEVATETLEMPAVNIEVTTDKQEITTEKQEITTEKHEIDTESLLEITEEKVAVATEKQKEDVDKEVAVATENQKENADKEIPVVTEKHKENADKEESVATENKKENADKEIPVVTEKQKENADKEAVAVATDNSQMLPKGTKKQTDQIIKDNR